MYSEDSLGLFDDLIHNLVVHLNDTLLLYLRQGDGCSLIIASYFFIVTLTNHTVLRAQNVPEVFVL